MSSLFPILLGFSIVASLGLISLAVYFFIVQPHRKRRPLVQALAIVENDDENKLPKAAALLGQALVSGLKKKDVEEARFALSYVRARLGKCVEALSVFADIDETVQRDRASVYLHLWLLAKEKRYDEVEELYEKNAMMLGGLLDTKLIAGIAFLKNARKSWDQREIELAISYYDRLSKLGVLTEEIPQRVDEHQVLLGVAALFDNHPDEALKNFKGAIETAKKDGNPVHAGQLGILLCRWSKGDTDDIEKELSGVIKSLQKDDKAPQGRKDKKKDRDTDDKQAADTSQLDKQTFLLRNCCLWYAFALLMDWLKRPARQPLAETDLKSLETRLEEVVKLDPEMPDPYLMGGLIAYYFSEHNPELRQAALEKLEKALQSGVNLPEVIVLLRKEKRREELYRDSFARFLDVTRQVIQSPDREEEMRRKLEERMLQFSRFREMGPVDLAKGDDDTAPSVAGMKYRTQILQNKLNKIVRPKIKDADPSVIRRFNETDKSLIDNIEVMTKKAEKARQNEEDLLIIATEFFSNEEQDVQEQTGADKAGGPKDRSDAGRVDNESDK
jgi:tetratricopeptide (TPR) repeat protein